MVLQNVLPANCSERGVYGHYHVVRALDLPSALKVICEICINVDCASRLLINLFYMQMARR